MEISNFVINFLNFFLLLVALKSYLSDQISVSVATARLLCVIIFGHVNIFYTDKSDSKYNNRSENSGFVFKSQDMYGGTMTSQ